MSNNLFYKGLSKHPDLIGSFSIWSNFSISQSTAGRDNKSPDLRKKLYRSSIDHVSNQIPFVFPRGPTHIF